MNYTVIDFETANYNSNSACSVALVVIQDGCIVKEMHELIKPPLLEFNYRFVQIHGITPQMVKDKPGFDELWTEFRPYIENSILIAHNAAFDVNVLRSLFDTYNIEKPACHSVCTVALARRVWRNAYNHRLPTIASMLGIRFKHHDALEDARACASILHKAMQVVGVDSLQGLLAHTGVKKKVV